MKPFSLVPWNHYHPDFQFPLMERGDFPKLAKWHKLHCGKDLQIITFFGLPVVYVVL